MWEIQNGVIAPSQVTMPKSQYTQIVLSYKYKVLSQYKSWDSNLIQSLGLHLIQREVFSSLTTTPQATSKRSLTLTFCHTTSEKQALYIEVLTMHANERHAIKVWENSSRQIRMPIKI